jgi:hypothetical protein
MKYMLMMNTMKAGSSGLSGWSEKDIEAMVGFMIDVDKELRATGELVFDEGLTFPNEAKLVRAGKNGNPITDGVFPPDKEFLAGFWIVNVASVERAYAIAARISMCPGPGGAPLYMPIEVRPVGSPPATK